MFSRSAFEKRINAEPPRLGAFASSVFFFDFATLDCEADGPGAFFDFLVVGSIETDSLDDSNARFDDCSLVLAVVMREYYHRPF